MNNLYFINNSSETKIVKNNDDSLYFLTRWLNCIRQLKIVNGQMYVYTLDGDNWSLDLIHEDGKYVYVKH